MKIVTLVENTRISNDFRKQHGLSFYVETKQHRLLFDLGQDDTFLYNAKKMGVDIESVDTVIISHGHYDHGGGLKAFLKVNQTAKIYVSQTAFENYYSYKIDIHVPIGLSPSLKNHPQIVYVGSQLKIDDELMLFSNITGRTLFSSSNKNLMIKEDNTYLPDSFTHEQALVITEGEKKVLFAGCAHNGIINILGRAKEFGIGSADVVIGGFHLYSPGGNFYEPEDVIREIGRNLLKEDAQFYTGHCTGIKAYEILNEEMKDKIKNISTGMVIEV